MRRSIAPVALGVAGLLAACGTASPSVNAGSTPGDAQPVVVVTTSILADLAEQLVDGQADIVTLLPAGVDAHDASLSAQDAVRLREAALVIANGLGYEEGIDADLDAAEADGVRVVRVGNILQGPILSDDDHDDEGEGDDHDHENADDRHEHGADPHVWLDPTIMVRATELLTDELTATGVSVTTTPDVQAAITAAHEAAIETLASVEPACRVLVTAHDSLGRFAEVYNFELGGSLTGSAHGAAASAQDVAELQQIVRDRNVGGVFLEARASDRDYDLLAQAADGVTVHGLYIESLSTADGPAPTYVEMITANAGIVAGALQGCGA